jgi:hypothetical protein
VSASLLSGAGKGRPAIVLAGCRVDPVWDFDGFLPIPNLLANWEQRNGGDQRRKANYSAFAALSSRIYRVNRFIESH